MKKTLLLLAALTLSPALYAQDYHVVLWDNATAPTSNGLTGEEIQPKPGQWSNTQKAEMWIYKAGDNTTGQAQVFFPGGDTRRFRSATATRRPSGSPKTASRPPW